MVVVLRLLCRFCQQKLLWLRCLLWLSGSYYSDGLVQFHFFRCEDEGDDLIVTWTSSVDGELSIDNSINSDGEISDYTYLTEEITLLN